MAAPHVVVIGAGPSGCLLALLLAEQGARVSVYDLRHDIRAKDSDIVPDEAADCEENSQQKKQERQRSINLALSTRGLTALRRAGMAIQTIVTSQAVPMHGRCVHSESGTTSIHPYGQPGQYLLSVSRKRLTAALVQACDEHKNVSLFFLHKCVDVDVKSPSVTFIDDDGIQHVVDATLVVGADGAFSRVRAAMMREEAFDYSQSYIPCVYKELSLSPPVDKPHGNSNGFTPNALHIWPRLNFMLIALPNRTALSQSQEDNSNTRTINGKNDRNSNHVDKHEIADDDGNNEDDTSLFTATLFMPREKFDLLKTPRLVGEFFEEHFVDAVPCMPNITEEFFNNPTSSLVTVRCAPYNYGGKAILIGDAAHAIVPFYGQGCNAALEDAYLIADSILTHGWGQLDLALDSYSRERKNDADAIAHLALEHYHDMSKRSVSLYFIIKRRVEIGLNRLLPHIFIPLYSLVSFSNVPYSQAISRSRRQDIMIGILICGSIVIAVCICMINIQTTLSSRFWSK